MQCALIRIVKIVAQEGVGRISGREGGQVNTVEILQARTQVTALEILIDIMLKYLAGQVTAVEILKQMKIQ